MIEVDLYKGKKILVYGLARSGMAAVASLVKGGAEVFVDDDDAQKVTNAMQAGAKKFAANNLEGFAALVLSPGVPLTHPAPHPIVKLAQSAGIPIISDIELLIKARPDAHYVGITGTNGKSTTTTLIAHLLIEAKKQVEVGGNLGQAALTLKPLPQGGFYVLELSSYQLELIPTGKLNIALLLNLTPDHLDRHGDMENYLRAKMNIFARQDKNDFAIIATDDDYTKKSFGQLKAQGAQKTIAVSTTEELKDGVYVKDGVLFDAGEKILDLKTIATLPGIHNWQNAAISYAAAKAAGVSRETIVSGLQSFKGLAHRQEQIATIGGIRFINDSKATNPEAAEKALACYDNIFWILGGKPKGDDLDICAPYFPKVKKAFLIGQAAAMFKKILAGKIETTDSGTIDKAVADAYAAAKNAGGGVVLLSPACASFDQFRDYEHRGDEFRRLVKELEPQARKVGT